MRKVLVFCVLAYLSWLLLKDVVRRKWLQMQGLEPPPQKGPRTITLVGAMLVTIYGGYLLWALIRYGWPGH